MQFTVHRKSRKLKLNEPVVAYIAESNFEAKNLVNVLARNGIDAHCEEDLSGMEGAAAANVGSFLKPKIWVDKSQLENAVAVLREFEEEKQAKLRAAGDAPPVSSTCDECGEVSLFAAEFADTVQDCPKCGKFMDVGDMGWAEELDWGEAESDSEE